MKTKSKISGYMIRSAAWAVFLSVAFIAVSWAFQSPNTWHKSTGTTGGYGSTAKSPSQPRALSFAERVAYQRAIEDVYWRHRIWPRNGEENPDPKPSLDAVMSQAQLEKKVEDYLRNSQSAGGLLAAADYCRCSYKLRWIVWRGTPGNRRYCASFLRRWGTIRLSLRNVLPGRC